MWTAAISLSRFSVTYGEIGEDWLVIRQPTGKDPLILFQESFIFIKFGKN